MKLWTERGKGEKEKQSILKQEKIIPSSDGNVDKGIDFEKEIKEIQSLEQKVDCKFGLENQMKRKRTQTGYNSSERKETPPNRV